MQNFHSPLLEGNLKKLKAIKYGVLTVATTYTGNKHTFKSISDLEHVLIGPNV